MLTIIYRMMREDFKNRNNAFFIISALVLGCLIILSISKPARNNTVNAEGNSPNIKPIWKISARNAKRFYFSPNSQHFIIVQKGAISLFNSDGGLIYKIKNPPFNMLALTPDASRAAAFSYKNPAKETVYFLDSKGDVEWKLNTAGAVWAADACLSQDGAKFFIGTGEKYIYQVNISDSEKRYERWRVRGAVVSLNVDTSGNVITFSTWQKSGVARINTEGHTFWDLDANQTCLPGIEMLATPSRILIRLEPNRSNSDGIFVLIDDNGDIICQGAMKASEKACVIPSPNGKYFALGFEKKIEHKTKKASERHVVLLDDSGHILCEKGSLILQAMPLAVTSKGDIILTDSNRSLFVMNKEGNLKKIMALPSAVKKSAYSRNGRYLALYCKDSNIYILRIVP